MGAIVLLALQHCGYAGLEDVASFDGRKVELPFDAGDAASYRFYPGWVMVSPTGNGFLLTGYPLLKQVHRDDSDDPALFVFYASDGTPVAETNVSALLAAADRKIATSCGGDPARERG